MKYNVSYFTLHVPFCTCPISGTTSGTVEVEGEKVVVKIGITEINYNYQVWQAIVAQAMIPPRSPAARIMAASVTASVLNEAPFAVLSFNGNELVLCPKEDDGMSRVHFQVTLA
jgi:hypothetical protein